MTSKAVTSAPVPTVKTGASTSLQLNLALQGGGAHGAYTWGVLDRLLDDDTIAIGDVCGASAGALNGAALVTGWLKDGRKGAKGNLALLWQLVAQAGSTISLLHLPLRKPGLGVWDDAMPLLSPYQINPLGMKPLQYILKMCVDIELMREAGAAGPRMSVNAVNVNTGYPRVFGPADISNEAIMASACAPFMFQAVTIDNDSYWDGSYGSNPALWPLYAGKGDVDMLMVELTPKVRQETPTTAKNILNRINELASIAGLVSELRLMALMTERSGQAVRTHLISLPDSVPPVDVEPSTKRTVDILLFETLKQQGWLAAENWLALHRQDLGVRSSSDLETRYLSAYAPPAGAFL
jgi:NTE family protein